MTLVMVLLMIAVVAGVAAVVTGAVSGHGLDEPASSIPARGLPTGPPTGRDVADLRFVQAFRGYRMDQVDAAMDGLAHEIDRLRSLLPEELADPPSVAAPAADPAIGVAPPAPAAATDPARDERPNPEMLSATDDSATSASSSVGRE